MEIKDYCRSVDQELTLWSSKLSHIVGQIDHLSTGKKQRMFYELNGLHILMAELEDRIEKLRSECSTEWQPVSAEPKVNFEKLGSKFNDSTGVFFDYDFGG